MLAGEREDKIEKLMHRKCEVQLFHPNQLCKEERADRSTGRMGESIPLCLEVVKLATAALTK